MNIKELIADLRSRVNPQYYDQIGTESYERHQCVMALESLMARNEVLMEIIADMRKETERLRGWIRVEGGCNNTCTRQILGEVCPSCRCGKTVKDAARSAKLPSANASSAALCVCSPHLSVPYVTSRTGSE